MPRTDLIDELVKKAEDYYKTMKPTFYKYGYIMQCSTRAKEVYSLTEYEQALFEYKMMGWLNSHFQMKNINNNDKSEEQ